MSILYNVKKIAFKLLIFPLSNIICYWHFYYLWYYLILTRSYWIWSEVRTETYVFDMFFKYAIINKIVSSDYDLLVSSFYWPFLSLFNLYKKMSFFIFKDIKKISFSYIYAHNMQYIINIK